MSPCYSSSGGKLRNVQQDTRNAFEVIEIPSEYSRSDSSLFRLDFLLSVSVLDEELELLRGTSLYTVTVHWKSQVMNDFRELEELVLPTDVSKTARDVLGECLTVENYMWALGTVR